MTLAEDDADRIGRDLARRRWEGRYEDGYAEDLLSEFKKRHSGDGGLRSRIRKSYNEEANRLAARDEKAEAGAENPPANQQFREKDLNRAQDSLKIERAFDNIMPPA